MKQKLYIGNLPYKTTENDLRKFFEKYEPIHSLILISDKATDHSRGYGFIELDKSKADLALSEFKNVMFNGRNMRLYNANGKDPRQKKHKQNTERKIIAARLRKIMRRNLVSTEYAVLNTGYYG